MSKKLTRELIAQKVKSDRIESIRNLNLWGSNIDDVSIIQEMPSLEIVSLSVNKIRSLRPFANLQNLRELYLRRNLIANLNEIKYLTSCENLSVLWLSENPICDNPNYRAVVVGVLPQLNKLDDVVITEEERLKAEKKLSGNYDEEDEQEEEPKIPNNKNQMQMQQQEEDAWSPKKTVSMKLKSNYPNNFNEEDNYYNNRQNQQRSNNRAREEDEYQNKKYDFKKYKTKQYDNPSYDDERDDYNNNKYNKSGKNGGIGESGGYGNNYGNSDAKNKKGNSNVLNCIIMLLKELSHNELQIVKREIDRLDN